MDRNSVIGWTLMGLLFVAMMYVMQQQKMQTLPDVPPGDERTEQLDTSKESPTRRTETIEKDLPETQPAFSEADESGVQSDSVSIADLSRKYGRFAAYLSGDEETTTVENDVLAITFSNLGGIPKQVILKEYKTYDQQPLVVYGTENGEFDITFSANVEDGQTAGFHTEDIYFQTDLTKSSSGDQVLKYNIDLGNGSYYEHEFVIPSEGYLIDFKLNTKNFDDVIYNRQDFFELSLKQRFESLENNIQTERMYSMLAFADSDYDTEKMGKQKGSEKDANYSVKWVSFKQKFFSTVLMTPEAFAKDGRFSVTIPEHKEHVKDVSANLIVEYAGGDDFNFPMQFYFGPNKYKTVKALDINLQQTMQLGTSVIRWVNLGIIIPMFRFLSKFISNYGLIILLLTLFIKLIVFPFTYKSYLSMIKMRVLQPELTELRAKFGKDQQKMGAAQMDLYRKAGVNPLGGCLPMLFQFPILIAMYRFFPASIELRQESFLWATDLSTFDSIFTWSQEIPFLSSIYGNHISLFTILMAITSFFYTRLNSMNTPTADPSNPMAQQMKMFQYIMPFMLLFIFNKFSAALSYYYFLFNLISVGQQYLMKRFLIDEDKIHAQIQENKKKVRTKSKWQSRMEDMMKQQQDQKKKKR